MVIPSYTLTDGKDASDVVRIGGMILDDWQKEIMDVWMCRNKTGRWAAKSCGISIPRQNGKTAIVEARAESGMILFCEQVIYTAHLQKTSTETFEEMRDFFESPAIKKYVRTIRAAIGREEIILKTGARIKFLARTRGGGRGQHGDLLIFDEAQELDADTQASFLPALAASANPQTIYSGTPPSALSPATVFRRIRSDAIAGRTKTTAWTEYSVPEIGDIHDRDRWIKTNPALGKRILESTIETEAEQLDDDMFARERLGWWQSLPENIEATEYALDADKWKACMSNEPKPEGKTAFGVKFSADGQEVCLSGAVIPETGPARISLIERKPVSQGTRWLADWLNQRYTKASCVVIDGKNGVDLLIDRIAEVWRLKGSIIRARYNDVIAAASLIETAVNEGTLTWYAGQPALSDSATTSIKRAIGGGWGFGGPDSTPIESAALALWGAKTSKRDPKKKMRIG